MSIAWEKAQETQNGTLKRKPGRGKRGNRVLVCAPYVPEVCLDIGNQLRG